ncbi:MAG: DivIVA domain-containing protein [Acidimicrobiales bacterium]
MDVTPQLLHDVEFREAKRGGYNTQDVDEFLERLAVGLERQEGLVADARERIEAAEARVADAERRAAQAEERASESSDMDDTLKRTLVLAQRTADAAIREAEEEAAKTLGSAQEQASRMLADAQNATARARSEGEEEARRAHRDARERVLAEMHQLEVARDQLRTDVEVLDRHLDEQRERLRHSVGALQALLDDPAALRPAEAPEVSDVTAPVETAPEAVAPPVVDLDDDQPPGPVPDDETWGEPAAQEAQPDDEVGPATQAVDVLAEDDNDDAYLTELRKAMTDDSPLGPREHAGGDDFLYDSGGEPARSRFGRRR